MTNETITINQFIAKHELLFSCKRVEKRADVLGDGMTRLTRHFRCSISNPGVGSFSLYFSQGSAHTQDPTLADVLDCLASAIKRQAEQLKRTLGQEAYEELLWNTERL
jgi:hypothetical protein